MAAGPRYQLGSGGIVQAASCPFGHSHAHAIPNRTPCGLLRTALVNGVRLDQISTCAWLRQRIATWGAPKLPDSPSNRMDVWKGEVIASTEEELLAGIQR